MIVNVVVRLPFPAPRGRRFQGGRAPRRGRRPLAAIGLLVAPLSLACTGCTSTASNALGCGPLVAEYGLSTGWGVLPAALQQLPSGGTLCGTASSDATTLQQTVVLTSMSASALVAFYHPLMAEPGCTLDPGTLVFTCSSADASAQATGLGQLHLFVTGAAPTVGTPPGQAGTSQVEPFVEIDYQP
jgi:hypothetical protein